MAQAERSVREYKRKLLGVIVRKQLNCGNIGEKNSNSASKQKQSNFLKNPKNSRINAAKKKKNNIQKGRDFYNSLERKRSNVRMTDEQINLLVKK